MSKFQVVNDKKCIHNDFEIFLFKEKYEIFLAKDTKNTETITHTKVLVKATRYALEKKLINEKMYGSGYLNVTESNDRQLVASSLIGLDDKKAMRVYYLLKWFQYRQLSCLTGRYIFSNVNSCLKINKGAYYVREE
ncbi:MAG: hypothetical protein JXQ23_03295 [Clostridia bacterium]|nr:hypothetical protein [Clostridia bacterium]